MPFPESSFARSGRFSEIHPVGRGAAGQVYSALDNLGRRVAVKEALPQAEGFAAFRSKFEKEARLQAALDHPNIVRVHHLEEDPDSGELYLICEYADAGSLAELLERSGPLPEPQAVALALDICAALEETAARRIVHRDVKPSNILLFRAPGGRLSAKLGDFGIAQDTRQRKTTMLPGISHPGTPLYMAPEQADVTVVVDSRADIFALALTLWEMLTADDYKALQRDGAGPALQLHRPDASPALDKVIARAARPGRDERYQTPREFADDLRRLLGREPLAPATRRLAPGRSERSALAPLSALGPLALTLALLLGTGLATGLLVVVFGVSLGPGDSPRGTLMPTSPPLFTPDPAAMATPVPAILAPIAPPFEPDAPTATPLEMSAPPIVLPPPTAPPLAPDTLTATALEMSARRTAAPPFLSPTNTPTELSPIAP